MLHKHRVTHYINGEYQKKNSKYMIHTLEFVLNKRKVTMFKNTAYETH